MHVGQIIKKLRKENGLTLVELSKESGVALATLSRIENGRMTGTLKSHIKICEALDIVLTDLYKNLSASKKTLEVRTKPAGGAVSVHDKKSSAIKRSWKNPFGDGKASDRMIDILLKKLV